MQNFDLKKIPFINPDENNKSFSFRIAILIEVEGKYLMVVNENDTKYKHPGGHIKIGESLIQAISREVKEEIGYEIVTLPDSPLFFDHININGNIIINGNMKIIMDKDTAEKIISSSPLKSKLLAIEELNEENTWKSEINIIKHFHNL